MLHNWCNQINIKHMLVSRQSVSPCVWNEYIYIYICIYTVDIIYVYIYMYIIKKTLVSVIYLYIYIYVSLNTPHSYRLRGITRLVEPQNTQCPLRWQCCNRQTSKGQNMARQWAQLGVRGYQDIPYIGQKRSICHSHTRDTGEKKPNHTHRG